MSEWELGSLDDVLIEVDDRNAEKTIELVLSVTEGRGIVPQTEVFKKRIATNDTSKYKAVEPLDIAWNPYLLWTGAVGQWLGSESGVTSPVYPIFRVRENQFARFWGLVLESGLLTPYFDSTAIGSIQRRRRTTVPVFKASSVRVPPLVEQRRIADVIAAVDAQIEAVAQELVALTRVTSSLRDELIGRLSNEQVVTLGEVLTIVRGGSPRPINDYLTDADEGINWIKIGDIRSGGKYVDHTAQKIRPEGRAKSREVNPGDFILSNSMSFGRPYIVRIHGCVHDGWLVLQDADDNFHQEYLYELLRSAQVQGEFERLAAGSGVRNLKRDSVRTVEVPLPDRERQREIATILASQHVAVDKLTDEHSRLRTFRSTLLTSLLKQEIEIPESYDALLEGVA